MTLIFFWFQIHSYGMEKNLMKNNYGMDTVMTMTVILDTMAVHTLITKKRDIGTQTGLGQNKRWNN